MLNLNNRTMETERSDLMLFFAGLFIGSSISFFVLAILTASSDDDD